MARQTNNLSGELYDYYLSISLREHRVLKDLRGITNKFKTAYYQIAPEQGQLLSFLVKSMQVKKAIEIGVYTGYSSLCIALSLPPDGKLIACDINEEWTAIAKEYWKKAGVLEKVELRLSPAIDTSKSLVRNNGTNTFDFAFIDADKTEYDTYYEMCLKLLRTGGIIAIDNIFHHGQVLKKKVDEKTLAIQKLNEKLLKDERVDITVLPIADGLTLVRKR